MDFALSKTDNGVTVSLNGSFTNEAATAFADRFRAEVPEGSSVEIDFSGVSGMDIEGLRKLITVDRWLKGRGGKLHLAGANEVVQNFLASNGVEKMFEMRATAAPAPRASSPESPPPMLVIPEVRERVKPTPQAERPTRAAAASPWEAASPVDTTSAWTTPPPVPEPTTTPSWTAPAPATESTEEPSAWGAPARREEASQRSRTRREAAPVTRGSGWDVGAQAPKRESSGSKLPWKWIGGGLGVGAAIVVTMQLMGKKSDEVKTSFVPNITYPADGEVISLDPGTHVDIKITATHTSQVITGTLPKGLRLLPPDTDGNSEFVLSGLIDEPVSEPIKIEFTPQGLGSTHQEINGLPVTVTLKFLRNVEFFQSEITAEAGGSVARRVVRNASACRVDPAIPGLAVSERDHGTWELKGSPTEAGKFTSTVYATPVDAGPEAKCPLVVEIIKKTAPPGEPTILAPPLTGVAPGDTSPTVTHRPPDPPPASQSQREEIPTELRTMIEDRIAAISPARLRPAMKLSIRNSLDKVEVARVIGTVEMGSGKSDLTPAHKQSIDTICSNPDVKELSTKGASLVIVGYASPKGSADYNLRLSRARATAVEAYFQKKGYIAKFCDGYGETKVRDGQNHTANQAVEIYLMLPEPNSKQLLEDLLKAMKELKKSTVAEEVD